MRFLPTLAFLALSASAFAATGYETDLNKAVDTAQSQNKMMFVIYGREACGNCQATKAMIKSHQIKVTDSKYVLVDLNCDDKQVSAEFHKRFGKENFGTTLPFVVVADSTGKTLASSGGYKGANEWEKILKDAQKKAAGTAPGKSTPSPFKNLTPGSPATSTSTGAPAPR